jgi:hypothetical protein
MSNFLDEAELFWKKVFGKIASPTISYIVEREAAISYFFSASSNLCICERREKTASP